MTVEPDQIYDGKVIRVTNYGAFVELPTGDTGLVHISEIDSAFVKNVEDHLRENDQVRVKVLAVKGDGKIDLSIRRAENPEVEERPRPRRAARDPEFEKMMKKFMKKSEQTLVDIKRNREDKRT